MQRIGDRFIYSASDLNDFLECRRLSELNQLVALEELPPPREDDEQTKLLRSKGQEHEAAYLAKLRAAYDVVEATDEHDTLAAMQAGARYIYQAKFFDGQFVGYADFLRRVEVPSNLGAWSYEVIDTKLALASKPYFLIQLCNYSEHLERLTGVAPRYGHIVLGNGREQSFDLTQFAAYYRHVKASFLARSGSEYPFKRSHCEVCPWNASCRKQRIDDDHLSLVAWMRRDQIGKFEGASIHSVASLADTPDSQRPFGLNEQTFMKLRRQALMQVRGRTEGPVFDIIAHEERTGFGVLPAPDDADVFFDMEGDPHYEPGRGLEYLFGAWTQDDTPFYAFWGLDRAGEKRALEQFVDFVMERRRKHPRMHVYHYAPYEKTALRKLAQAHATRETEVDEILRGEVLVDLYAVVRQAIVISEDSYSIKRLEKFYNFKRDTEVRRGDDSILMFERWRMSGDRETLQKIEDYNRDDCYSTMLLRNWLLDRRDESADVLGAIPAFRELKDGSPGERSGAIEEARRSSVEAQLLDNESDTLGCLIGALMGYHRREEKPGWWAYFDRRENFDRLLEFDREAIAGLQFADDIAPYRVKNSTAYTYRFPEQQYKASNEMVDPLDGITVGDILAIDRDERTIVLKTTADEDSARELSALIPRPPINTSKQREAIARVADAYVAGKLSEQFPAIADMLARTPRFAASLFLTDAVRSLERSYLFIQGPPGTGKTTKSASVICDLLSSGKRVGIVSSGHKPVQHLLHMVEAEMHDRGQRFTGLYKHSGEASMYVSRVEQPMIESTGKNELFTTRDYDLAGGTPWLFSREFNRPFDYLFIDEAGQLSIADAVAVSTCARNVVLLGDPAQLAQVSEGSHPFGTDLSILEHLLGNAHTVPDSEGVLLDVSYRMHPEICAFISEMMYDGRLHAGDKTGNHAVQTVGLTGAGLRYLPIEHAGNSAQSDEEAHRIVHEIELLLQGTVTDDDGVSRAMRASDIIVVTPYNAQRSLIEHRLRQAQIEVAVGTVDKFQGQQAAVVFYSMATSSGDDVPRDLGFLFEQNRLNVAVSRARAMTVLVCSPRLLDVACATPEQMALVNFLCAYVEKSTLPVRPGVSAAANASAALLSG